MSYVDIVGKRADELAGNEWDSMGVIAQHWAQDAIQMEGSDRAYRLAIDLYTTALSGNSIGAELDAMRDLFIFEKSDLIFYSVAEQEIKEEQADAADALKEEYYDARQEEARQSHLRG